jgi:4-hydroxy-2-oxoheptanedioate aldolase
MILQKLEEILLELKSLGAVGLKTSFEDEGAEFKDIMILRKLTNKYNLKLVIKIGGAEANTDIDMAISLDCDGLVAPMIESKYAIKKYLQSIEKINKFSSIDIEKGINLETISAHRNLEDLLSDSINKIDSITIGRVDLIGSLEKSRDYINSDEIFTIVNNSFKYIKNKNNNINTYLGGSINNESYNFILKTKHLLNFVETRYIVFDVNKLLKNYERCVELANLFEYNWLLYINFTYKIEKNNNRIEQISKRINLSNDKKYKNSDIKNTLILYAYHENKDSKENLIFFFENGIIDNSNYQYYIGYTGDSIIDFDIYTKKFKNLKILKTDSINAWSCWQCILSNNNNKDNFNNFIFMKDKILGPFNKNKINKNWIEYITDNLSDSNIIIAGYGTSPLGKLYKYPYIPDKFICLNKKILKFLIKNDVFKKFTYNSIANFENHPDNLNIKNNPEYGVEIRLSKLLLDNDIEYYSIDKNGINNLNILKIYKKKNYKELFNLNKNLHSINDTTIEHRFFWTSNSMRKIFIYKDKKYLKLLKNKRDTSKLKIW